MIKFKDLQPGDILSETSYTTVQEVNATSATLLDTRGNKVTIGKEYLEAIHDSADQFDDDHIQQINQSEMIKLLFQSSRIACSVYYQKADKPKTKKAIKAEIEEWTANAMEAFLAKGQAGLEAFAVNQVKDYIPGEMRLMRGYHEAEVDERGRLKFIDMEDKNIHKLVDPRTLEYIIVKNVKYILKK